MTIRDENGVMVTIDMILAKLPNITQFFYHQNDQVFTNETFRTMNSLVFNSKFRQFHCDIRFIQSDIDFSLLCDFIKKNSGAEFFVTFECVNPEFHKNVFLTVAREQLTSVVCPEGYVIRFDECQNLAAVWFKKAPSSNVE